MKRKPFMLAKAKRMQKSQPNPSQEAINVICAGDTYSQGPPPVVDDAFSD